VQTGAKDEVLLTNSKQQSFDYIKLIFETAKTGTMKVQMNNYCKSASQNQMRKESSRLQYSLFCRVVNKAALAISTAN
jgi:ribosomal protein L33